MTALRRCGCGAAKRAWPTFDRAVQVIDFRIRRDAQPLRVYPCPAGHGWHITKQWKQVKGERADTGPGPS